MRRILAVLLLLLPLAAEAKKPPPPPPADWAPSTATLDDLRAGNAALQAKKFEEAAIAFDGVLALEPQCGQALVGKGRALVLAGKAADALPPLDAAAALYADKLDVHTWRARALLDAGRPADAMGSAKTALALKPTNVDALRVGTSVLRGEKKFDEAHAMLADARKLANLVAFDCLDGLVYADQGDMARAAEMNVKCEGVPDAGLRKELADRVAAPAQ